MEVIDLVNELITFFKERAPLGRSTDISEDSRFTYDMQLDSLSQMEMLMMIEDKYSISISDDDAHGLYTIHDVAVLIDELRRA